MLKENIYIKAFGRNYIKRIDILAELNAIVGIDG